LILAWLRRPLVRCLLLWCSLAGGSHRLDFLEVLRIVDVEDVAGSVEVGRIFGVALVDMAVRRQSRCAPDAGGGLVKKIFSQRRMRAHRVPFQSSFRLWHGFVHL